MAGAKEENGQLNDAMTGALAASLDFVQADSMQRICEAVQFPSEVMQALLIETERLAADKERADQAVGFHRALFLERDRPSGEINQELLALEDGAMLAAVVYAGAIPQLWKRYAERGIPAQVLIDTVHDLVIWMETHRKRHGRWGLSELGWLHIHLTGGLYRTGRLQFQPISFPYAVRVFRNRNTGEEVALSESGIRFLPDGRLAEVSEGDDALGASVAADASVESGALGASSGAAETSGAFSAVDAGAGTSGEAGEWGASTDAAEASGASSAAVDVGVDVWLSAYAADDHYYEGHPISRLGIASRETVQLPADDWDLALRQGDHVLNVHIPEGGRMSHEACLASYASAERLFADCFPDQPFLAYVCSSWLLSPEFREWLPEQSNIRQFQSDYHLLPLISDETQTLERVFGFGTKLADLPNLKAETSLQRVVHERLTAGERMHNGCGYILKG